MGQDGQSGRLRLASSFGAAAVAYAQHRPDYAHVAVRWALERAPGPRVLDLGAGTGVGGHEKLPVDGHEVARWRS